MNHEMHIPIFPLCEARILVLLSSNNTGAKSFFWFLIALHVAFAGSSPRCRFSRQTGIPIAKLFVVFRPDSEQAVRCLVCLFFVGLSPHSFFLFSFFLAQSISTLGPSCRFHPHRFASVVAFCVVGFFPFLGALGPFLCCGPGLER